MTDIQHLSRPDGETLAFKRIEGGGPTVVWVGGFRSDMEGSKALAISPTASPPATGAGPPSVAGARMRSP